MIVHSFSVLLSFSYFKDGSWYDIPASAVTEAGMVWQQPDAVYFADFQENESGFSYRCGFQAFYDTQLRFSVSLMDEEELFHLIPCNIYGNNHDDSSHGGEFPILTEADGLSCFRAPRWEFRADRAATPVSILCCKKGVVGLSVQPYSETHEAELPNGLFAELPNRFGISIGYTNDPVTFVNKRLAAPSVRAVAREASACGSFYAFSGHGRQDAHRIIRAEYPSLRCPAAYSRTPSEAVVHLADAFIHLNFDRVEGEYTNRNCRLPSSPSLLPWRHVCEIGWTGGGVLAYPLLVAGYLYPQLKEACLREAAAPEDMIERMLRGYNPTSGLLNDLMRPRPGSESPVNGWWADFGLVKDVHCAYNVGSCLHYVLRSILFLKDRGLDCPSHWLDTCRRVLDTVLSLQRGDGAYGYTYCISEKKVADWDGFAGCWFAPCFAYLYHFTGDRKYRISTERALLYYSGYVKQLNCWGTPMDTWKSVDEEGNLAFVRGCRLMYEYTQEPLYLELLKAGAEYEYLWRYAYRTHPLYSPLKDGWNACGGSVTSVSNPHIHPMGVIIDGDLRYLARVTGDSYHEQRAEDSFSWLMQTLEMYPEKTGYGRYGILSERWCPSDGLTIERYDDGSACCTWFSYNLWAAANALEAVCEWIIEKEDH